MIRSLSLLSEAAYRLNNNPFSWPQRTKLYRLGEADDVFRIIDVCFGLKEVPFRIRSVGFD